MYPNFRDIKSRGEERTLEPLSQFCSLSQVWSAPGTHIIRRTPNSIWAGGLLSGKVKEAVLESKGLHSASVFSNFISMLFYWEKKTRNNKVYFRGSLWGWKETGHGKCKEHSQRYILYLCSSVLILCSLLFSFATVKEAWTSCHTPGDFPEIIHRLPSLLLSWFYSHPLLPGARKTFSNKQI